MGRRDKKQSSFIRRLLGLRVVLVVNVVILILLSLSFGREFVRNYSIQKDVAELRQTAKQLEARNLEIAEMHTQMQTESFIEKEARLKLGLKKPGERVIVVQEEGEGQVPEQEANTANAAGREEARFAQAADRDDKQSISNAKKWWYYFFDQQSFEQINYD
jgi:cell division protein FtsB